ncbi:uncharacterized protein LOC116845934 [Odontomachus brunneus]|uniref:uncharacterized protein LOC116845934 n=1 Tax=Odontomachus brunneus TaxID=486640 RepID=UPI0013F25F36|nr:uncharacterized protein LOC116845934 [Odontomachus brunneus]
MCQEYAQPLMQTEYMGKKLRDTSSGSMESGSVYLFRNMGSFETIFVDDTNQVTLHSAAQPTRSMPNILRSSNARGCKNYKTFVLAKDVPLAEDATASFDLNAALPSDSERDGRCSKIASPKSHHQRKQVHHPLDVRFDVPGWHNNNNTNEKGEDASQTISELETLHASLGREEGTPMKKMDNKHNKHKEHRCLFKKSTRAVTGKSGDKKTAKLVSGFDTGSSVLTAEVNMADSATAQSGARNNFLDVFTDIVEAGSPESDVLADVFCDDFCEENADANRNSIVASKSTEYGQQDALQKDSLGGEFAAEENGWRKYSMSKENRSNFLLASEVLCTCACANCTICDRDFVLYEDSVPSHVNSDAEAELFASYAYDFYTSDYYHVLGDIDGFDKFFSYDFGEDTSAARENACNGNDLVTKSIETDVPIPVKQCELKNSLCTDKAQDICVEQSSVELVTLSNDSTEPSKLVERIRDLDEANYLNLQDFSMEVNETTSRNQDTASTNVPVPALIDQPHKKKKDVCIIQCTECNRLFSKKKFRKHFTRCTFYKEDFKCHVCNKIYRYKSSLVQHLKAIHNISDSVYEKYYICEKCQKSYVRFRAFQRHLLTHDNW